MFFSHSASILITYWTPLVILIRRQAQRPVHQLRLKSLCSSAFHLAFIGQITSPVCLYCVNGEKRLNIYFCRVQNGQQNANDTLVTPLTSQMCSGTIRNWWNSWVLISSGHLPSLLPTYSPVCWARHDSNNKVVFSRPYWVVRSRLWYDVVSICLSSV